MRGRYLEICVRFFGAGPNVLPHSPVLCDLSASHGLGDLNCDGVVSVYDIDAFVLALTDRPAYERRFGCDRRNADVNGDGAVNNFDIDPPIERIMRRRRGARLTAAVGRKQEKSANESGPACVTHKTHHGPADRTPRRFA